MNKAWCAANADSLSYENDGSLPSMSADGKWIEFDSMASNSVPGDRSSRT